MSTRAADPDDAAAARQADRLVLLATKVQPPRVRDQFVPRQRLVDRLDAGSAGRLTLVACPAGFGKTSLLAAWHASRAPERPTAWLTLDKDDNDPVVLWSYVVEALRRDCPDIADAASSVVPGAPVVMELMLPRLVNALAAHEGITLVLDDFQVLTAGPARDSLTWLLEQAPPSFHLVVASRKEPDLPLARLRAHGELVELRVGDLRFTEDECGEFVNGREGLGLSPDDIGLLVKRTDGWPAGVYLAALSLRRAQDRHDLVARFGASNRHVVDFLEAEVMQSHDQSDQDFMVRCAVLDQLSGPLCDYVLSAEGSADTLLRLSRSNLFLVPQDDEGLWYRFHPLFAQLMRVELRRKAPGLEPSLHQRAYAWHREHGSIAQAIDHAIEADLYAEAADLVAACWVEYTNGGREATIESWLERFPEAIATTDPRLLLATGFLQWLTGRHEEIDGTISRIERELAEHSDPSDVPSDVTAGLATLKATPPRRRGGQGEDLSAQAVALSPRGSLWRPVACWAAGLERYAVGDLAEADQWFAECVELAPGSGQWLVGDSSLGYRSLIAGERDDRDAQVRLADEAVAFMRRHGLDDVAVDAWHAHGVALAAQGRFADARPVLQHAVEVARFRGQVLLLARALRSYALALRQLGEDDAAADAEKEAVSILDTTPDRRRLATRVFVPGRDRAAGPTAGVELTQRELTVLTMLTGSRSEADIARELFVSHSTVHSHTRSIYRKLGVSSRTEAARRASEAGLV